jgi:hypothetical protein
VRKRALPQEPTTKEANMNKLNTPSALLAAAIAVATLAGCASAPPRPTGAIVPMGEGRYQSAVKSADVAQALKTFTRDAEITCAKPDGKARMPWDAQPAPAKYAVISQSVKNKDGKEIKSSDNKMLDTGVALGLRKFGLEAQDAVEVSTIFKCE